MMRFFSKRSLRCKLIGILTAVNLIVLIFVVGGFFLQQNWFSSGEVNFLFGPGNAVFIIFSAAFFVGLFLSTVLVSWISKPLEHLVQSCGPSSFFGHHGGSLSEQNTEDEFVFLSVRYEEMRRALDEKALALQTSAARYERIAQGANDGLWDWDLKTDQIYFSPRWQALLGYEPGEIGDKPSEWFERIYPDDFLPLQNAISTYLQGETPRFEHVFRMQHKTGGFRWMMSRGVLVRDEEGTPVYIGGSQSDITSLKTNERAVHPVNN